MAARYNYKNMLIQHIKNRLLRPNQVQVSEGQRQEADVCLIVEGAYPYVAGGVSSWLHDLINTHSHLSFCLVALVSNREPRQERYKFPANVIAFDQISLQELHKGYRSLGKDFEKSFAEMEQPLTNLQTEGGLPDLKKLVDVIKPYRQKLGRRILLNSKPAWQMLLRMYQSAMSDESFINYFWTQRALCSGLYATLTAPLPKARVYHAISTGYAGLLAARAKLEEKRPVIVTEHGIYTNERRIEILTADWLTTGSNTINLSDKNKRDLRDVWLDTFASYARACYAACDHIITLYEGNQSFQRRDGADPQKLQIIPNGIDFERFAALPRAADLPPTIALIGRVVPIKDIKTFIRACVLVRKHIPHLQALVLGPTEEDAEYYQECLALVEHLSCSDTIRFLGKVRLEEYLSKISVVVLTSVSEAQPLVILEAGAAGIPMVATDVGACRELILGHINEQPRHGPGGAITPLASPQATAEAIKTLLIDPEWHQSCSRAIQTRVRAYYYKPHVDTTYRNIYESLRIAPDTDLHF